MDSNYLFMNSNTMKFIFVPLALLLLLNLSIVLASCGSHSAPTEADKTRGLLNSGAWKVDYVTVDGTDQTDVYKNFTISFSGNTYSTTNGGGAWSVNGTWQFIDATGKQIKRSDNLVVNINEVSASKLVLSFTLDDNSYSGRSSSVGGLNVFTLIH